MNQKLTITLTTISLSLVAFLSGYLISQTNFHRSPSSNSTGNILDKFNNPDTNTNPQTDHPETIRLLSQRTVVSPVISKDSDAVTFYEKGTGKVFEVTLKNTSEKMVSSTTLPNLIKTIWAPSRKEVVSLFYSPQNNHYKYYDSKTKASVDLGNNIKSISFSPEGDQIAYFNFENDSSGIFISQPDGTISKKIFNSHLGNAEVYWPSKDDLAFKTDNTTDDSTLFSLSIAGELTKLLDSKQQLKLKWSENGKKLLFSDSESGILNLFYKNTESEEEVSLGVATSASKCAWSIDAKSVICGVPKSSTSGEEIYEIFLDGTKKLISSPNSNINVGEIFLSNLGDYIVVLNDLDNKLYVLKK